MSAYWTDHLAHTLSISQRVDEDGRAAYQMWCTDCDVLLSDNEGELNW